MSEELFDKKTILLACVIIICAIVLQGCVMPFSGERNAKCKVNVLGNTVEWESSMAGTYVESGVAK